MANNRFVQPVEATARAVPQEPRRQQAIWLSRCTGFRVERNVLSDPENQTSRDTRTGSALLGYDQCNDVLLDGRPQP
ncbi:MAG: hypothetical protein ACYC3X_28795 [Pirellulaceae bacterium]